MILWAMTFRPKSIYMFQKEISQLNLKQLKAGEKRWVGSLLGSSAALLLKEIAEQSRQLLVLVAKNNQHVAQLESELEFYGIKPIIFPDWEILPYDRLSPHQDIVSGAWLYFLICLSRAYYYFQPLHWHSELLQLHGY